MAAVSLLFGAEMRHRWRSWLLLVLVMALVGGAVLASAAAGRRTAAAFPQFLGAHGYDAIVYSTAPLPALGRQPEVSSLVDLVTPLNGRLGCTCPRVVNAKNSVVFDVPPPAMPRLVKLIAGRMPEQSSPDEVLASFTLEQSGGIRVGSVIRVPFYAPRQLRQVVYAAGAEPVPRGPTVTLRVVGIEASEPEFPSGNGSTYDLYTTAAFARSIEPRAALLRQYYVRLRHGASDLPSLVAYEASHGAFGTSDLDGLAVSVAASIHPQAVGWWILAMLLVVAGLAVIGQALVRQSILESEQYSIMAALGLAPRQIALLGLARNLVVGLAGGLGAVLIAALLSPLTPVGEARLAEPSTGFKVDAVVLGFGAVAIVVVCITVGGWASARPSRRKRSWSAAGGLRTAALVDRLAAAGASPSAVVGVRNALDRGRGPGRVPVGTALVGAVLAVTAVSGTAVFGTSLSHLTATPRLYGDTYDLFFNASASKGSTHLWRTLQRDGAISRISVAAAEEISVRNVEVDTIVARAIRGPVLLALMDGHFPEAPGEIALGVSTMKRIGAHLGSVVPVRVAAAEGAERTTRSRVVGGVLFPGDFGSGSFGTGAVLSVAGYLEALCPDGPGERTCMSGYGRTMNFVTLASAVPGSMGKADVTRYLQTYPSVSRGPVVPTSLVNFGEAVNFPLLVGVIVTIFGAATLLHLLVVSVARRRREIGLLKALGFVNRQVAASVCWQATTVALMGLVIGVPIGVALGRVTWQAFATNLGVVPVAIVQVRLLGALALGFLVVSNLIAVMPALVATRFRAGQLLRAE